MGKDCEYIVQMFNCQKRFSGVLALKDVSLSLKRGEVHALIGENGAGKSTIMKILAGIHTLDCGEIFYDGIPFIAKNPKDSLAKGIAMIHQELNLLSDMTVEENLFLGREIYGPLRVVKKRSLRKLGQKYFDDLGIEIDVTVKLRTLSVAQMQMVEIVKATTHNADIIIMDEPTSAITDTEVEKLFEIINKLKMQNKAIVYISHKMDEIYRIADRITILRDGEFIDSREKSKITTNELIRLMVGRELKDMYTKNSPKTADYNSKDILLDVQRLCGDAVEDISFKVRRGEILGIYGLMGAGRTELVETVFGLRKRTKGYIKIKGKIVKRPSPCFSIRNGMAFISEDRKLFGLNLNSSVRTNICDVYLKKVTRARILLDFNKEKKIVDEYLSKLRIKTAHRNISVNSLSGGNQQKVVLAKWLIGEPDILIMDEPTRGIDIGTKAEIYKIMDKFVKAGKSIVMISSEMPELMGMSDRIMVLNGGRKTGEFKQDEFDQERLLKCAMATNSKRRKMV